MEQEILRAPPRRIAALKLALLVAAGLAVVGLGKLVVFPYLRVYLAGAADRADAIHRFQIVFDWLGGLLLLMVGYMAWITYRVIVTGQWPLPGMLVLRDTPIQRGRTVYFRGLAMSVLTLAMIVLTALMFFLPQSLFSK